MKPLRAVRPRQPESAADIELGPPNSLLKRGWTKQSVLAGIEVTVVGYQSKDGAKRANWSRYHTPPMANSCLRVHRAALAPLRNEVTCALVVTSETRKKTAVYQCDQGPTRSRLPFLSCGHPWFDFTQDCAKVSRKRCRESEL